MTKQEKEQMIREIAKKMADFFEKEIPPDVMKTSDAVDVMYGSLLLNYSLIAKQCQFSRSEVFDHISLYFDNTYANEVTHGDKLN
jgi:uncharacterized protein YfkK (UPF0435 family)